MSKVEYNHHELLADGLMDDRLEGDNAPAMNSEDDDSELNENLIEDDLEDNIPEQPLANLAGQLLEESIENILLFMRCQRALYCRINCIYIPSYEYT